MKPVLRKILYTLLAALCFFIVSTFLYVLYLRWCPPLTTPLMIIRAMENRPAGKKEFRFHCSWKSYDDISDQLKVAVIASEDQQFAFHHGLDYDAIFKAAKHNWNNKKVIGASTISQQVAKNVFLWPGRTYLRKSLEVYFTWLIELLWGKKRILEMYLNAIEMGDGIFGAESASRAYFRKPASDLSPREAALLAAILPNPRKFSAVHPTGYISAKTGRIQIFMRMINGTAYLKNIE